MARAIARPKPKPPKRWSFSRPACSKGRKIDFHGLGFETYAGITDLDAQPPVGFIAGANGNTSLGWA